MMQEAPAAQRVDRWLWSARFFKTRSLATRAVSGGKVHVNGERVKPARVLKPGDRLEISRGRSSMQVEVLALSQRRGPAREAALLYRETEGSRERRASEAERRRQQPGRTPAPERRPDKKARRQLERLRRGR